VTGPLKLIDPSLVTEPIADVVSIAGIDEDRNLSENLRHKGVVRLHPVTSEHEVAVDVHVAAVVRANLGSDGLHNLGPVKVFSDPAKSSVAKIAIFARTTNVVDIATGALVGTNHVVVAVHGGGHAEESTAGFLATRDETLATLEGVVHGLALALAENSLVATLTAGHGAVVLVLSVGVSQTVTNENGLKVDVAVLVGQDFGSKDRNVVTSVRFTRDVEVLLGVLGKLVEEEGEQGVNVLAGSNGVANAATRVREANVDGLVKEDDRAP
jgi:hypothetical protein